ncbi:transmembrane signal receptor [Lithospermum erythrorhizon]|uniref:Transmembrane signal receptor n=1 Tax=Lithospermum erythrorhizon TaxID=34254 RepID=A0AAV3PFV6_LITER
MDVHNAFLHGDLSKEVYMRLPPGFGKGHPGMVCQLHKSLYGLKQASGCWFSKLTAALKRYGFVQSYADYSLFTMCKDVFQLHVLVYVDLIIFENDSAAISKFKQYLSSFFHMKDLGVLKYFLGVEIARSHEGLFLSQQKYALDIVFEAGLLGARPVAFPMEQNHRLGISTSPLLQDVERFRRLVGRLLYLSFTRPDLTYVVQVIYLFLHAPRQDQWVAALQIADLFTKSLGWKQFEFLLRKLSIQDFHAST